jgi:hypothetical protein
MLYNHEFTTHAGGSGPLLKSVTMPIKRITGRYRFALVLAVDRIAQEYFLCLQTQLATMTIQQFTAALTHALSFRVWELNETGDPLRRDGR